MTPAQVDMPEGDAERAVSEARNGAGPNGAVELRLSARTVLRVLLAIVGILLVLALLAHLLRFGFNPTFDFGFIRLFDPDRESNIPTWFSSALMASCALMLGLIAAASKSANGEWFGHWAGLGAIFVLMSLDEIVQVHERFIIPLRETFGLSGLLTNAWIVIAFAVLPVLALIYARFLIALPRRSGGLFVLSGTVYIAGVVGVEMVSGLMKSTYGTEDLRFVLVTTLEETLEMLGLGLFAFALVDYAAGQGLEWRLRFHPR